MDRKKWNYTQKHEFLTIKRLQYKDIDIGGRSGDTECTNKANQKKWYRFSFNLYGPIEFIVK